MLLDRRDIEILRLTGRYRWLPFDSLEKYGFDGLTEEIGVLLSLELIWVAKSGKYLMLTPAGNKLLGSLGYPYDTGANRAFAGNPALRRRLEVVDIMLTCRRAGIDTLQDDVDCLQNQPVFFPAFLLRIDMNLMNAANCAGFGHWGNKAYMLQYVSRESPGMYLEKELQRMHNLASVFGRGLKTPNALILAGPGYGQVYEQLQNISPSKRHGAQGFCDFWEVYRITDLPIHLLSCDETGALQLAIMSQADHNAKIAQAAFGDRWKPHDVQIAEADGCVDGNPLVIAADMDIRRVERVCQEAANLGRAEVMVAALGEQMTGLLLDIVRKYRTVTPLRIEPVLEAAFGKGFSLYNMDRSPATDAQGGVIHV